ncbi:MAG: bifunctional demethylmenaquinone methyltransferase/2-methoxy-6-polyprenyl-1,4-benzoquinol methylase UbiE [Myxococcales bacterium]
MTADPAAALGSGAMFDRIADRYDLLNRVLSFGIDRGWRRLACEALRLQPGQRILDLATGTGDLALRLAAHGARPAVVGADPSRRMLALAERKAREERQASRIAFLAADAQRLPFGAGAFDAACIAFGIRNVPDRPQALRELARVIRPGGRVAILELCEPSHGLFGRLGRLYVHELVPRIGAWLSGAREYRYLQESIARFPPPAQFADLMSANGFSAVSARQLTLGVCCLFAGTVPERP